MPVSYKRWIALVVVVVLAGACLAYALREKLGRQGDGALAGKSTTVGRTPNDDAGFQERAIESGLDFRMMFLPNEQGEKFKINLYDHGCGIVIGDYDGDGGDDIFFLNQLGPNALYRNKGDGTFQNVTRSAGPIDLVDRICVGGTFGDYDNDGDQDLFITTTRGGNALFENQGNGHFVEVTKKAGVELIAHSQTPAFFDYDLDGDLDLFVTNSAKWTTDEFDPQAKYFIGLANLFDLIASPKEFNVLYRNNDDGTFTDVTEQAGVAGQGWGGDVAVFDFDEDGHPDLLVSNMFGSSQLYHNEHNGTFQDVTSETLKKTSFGAIGIKAFSLGNDGRLDLFIADMHSDMWMPYDYDLSKIVAARKYPHPFGPTKRFTDAEMDANAQASGIDYRRLIFGNTLFKNLGKGQFKEISDKAGMETFWPWGIATGDFDNDGFEDVFIPSGMGYPFAYWPNYLMMNKGDGTFANEGLAHGIEPESTNLDEKIGDKLAPRSSRCAATADFDGDGRLDLVVNNFNDRPFYFRNHFPERHYVSFRLTGTRSNRDAVGALVKVYVGDEVFVRQVQSAGGYLSQSSKTVHVGLGGRTRIDKVEIRWPRVGGQLQTIETPKIDMLHAIEEP